MKILYSGGLQIRSEGAEEQILNINTFTSGDFALYELYSSIEPDDYPIAQDCFGDQFFIRKNKVIKLMAETGDIEEYNYSWEEFLNWVDKNPEDTLDIPENLDLKKGQLLFAYPPFCTEEGSNATIKPINGMEVIKFHADLATQINGG